MKTGDIYLLCDDSGGVIVDDNYAIQLIPEFKYFEIKEIESPETIVLLSYKNLTEDDDEKIITKALTKKFNWVQNWFKILRIIEIYEEVLNIKMPREINLIHLINRLKDNDQWEFSHEQI